MLCLGKPSNERIQRFMAEQAKLPLTYLAIGATAGTPPDGFVIDHTRYYLGMGEVTFRAARKALLAMEQFHLGWLEAARNSVEPFRAGDVIGLSVGRAGIWSLNACRIVYTIDESEPVHRFGFAYGTLPSHVGTGEERFVVEWDSSVDSVHYDILAFSRPHAWYTRIAYPVMRRVQKRFGRDSGAAVNRFVNRELAGAFSKGVQP